VRYQIKVREPDESVEVRVIRFTSADAAYTNEPLASLYSMSVIIWVPNTSARH